MENGIVLLGVTLFALIYAKVFSGLMSWAMESMFEFQLYEPNNFKQELVIGVMYYLLKRLFLPVSQDMEIGVIVFLAVYFAINIVVQTLIRGNWYEDIQFNKLGVVRGFAISFLANIIIMVPIFGLVLLGVPIL